MWGIEKKRRKLGEFIDRQGYSPEEIREASKVGRNTISKACSKS
jgi:transposase